MAPNPISSITVQQFRDIYIERYQAEEKLANSSQEVHGVVGDAYKWPRIDGADMHDRGSYGSIIPATIRDHTRVITTFEDYVLNLPVDRGEQTLINVNERASLARSHAQATGRRKDKWKIDALTAGTQEVAVGTTNLTVAKLRAARKTLLTNNVPCDNKNDLLFAMHASQADSLLAATEVTSADYNTVRALVDGKINTYMGFTFIVFGDVLDKNTGANLGLPKTGNNRTCFAWHRDALGSVFKLDPTIDVEWSPERVSWLSISQLIGGASILQNEGVVKVICDETK